MCIVCTEWEKGKLTNEEALRNLHEIADPNDFEHNEDIVQRIFAKEFEERKKQEAANDEGQ